jgi:hypothetical protein
MRWDCGIARQCRKHTKSGSASIDFARFCPGSRSAFRPASAAEALYNYRTVRATSTGLAVDEPVHDWASHASDALRTLAEADAAWMLDSVGSTTNIRRRPATVFRGNFCDDPEPDFLDWFFTETWRRARLIR